MGEEWCQSTTAAMTNLPATSRIHKADSYCKVSLFVVISLLTYQVVLVPGIC